MCIFFKQIEGGSLWVISPAESLKLELLHLLLDLQLIKIVCTMKILPTLGHYRSNYQKTKTHEQKNPTSVVNVYY